MKKKTKIVVSSDWHLDAITSGQRRLDDIIPAIEQTIDIAIYQDADFYIMLGDLTDPNNVRSHRAIAQTLSLPLSDDAPHQTFESVFITGNHDVIEDGSGDHTMLALKRHYTVFDRPYIMQVVSGSGKAINVVALPFTPSSHSYDPSKFIEDNHVRINPEFPTLVLGHLNIEGITPGSETDDMPRGREVFWPFKAVKKYLPDAIYLNGHYHNPQVYRDIIIPGSLVRLSFGEVTNKPSFLVLEI